MIVFDKKNKKKIALAAVAVPVALFLIYAAMPATVVYKGAQIGNPTLDFQVQTAEKIFTGTVKSVELKPITTVIEDTPIGGSEPETFVSEELFQVITVDVGEYLVDERGEFSSQVQFIDVVSGCYDLMQKKCQVHELAIEYKVGEKGLFIVERIGDPDGGPLDGLLSTSGYLNAYMITGDEAKSEYGKSQDEAPQKLEDLKQEIKEKYEKQK